MCALYRMLSFIFLFFWRGVGYIIWIQPKHLQLPLPQLLVFTLIATDIWLTLETWVAFRAVFSIFLPMHSYITDYDHMYHESLLNCRLTCTLFSRCTLSKAAVFPSSSYLPGKQISLLIGAF